VQDGVRGELTRDEPDRVDEVQQPVLDEMVDDE
jgi:hypothetical protein